MVKPIKSSVCSKEVVEDFWDIHFSHVIIEGMVVNSNTNDFSSFPGTLFTVLIYYHEVEDVASGLVVGNATFLNCAGYITIVFFYSIFQTSAGFSYVRKVANFFWAGPFVDYVLF